MYQATPHRVFPSRRISSRQSPLRRKCLGKYSRYYCYASCDPADAYLPTGGSRCLEGASSNVIVSDRGIVRRSREGGRGIDYVDDGDDVVGVRIGNAKDGTARGAAVGKEIVLDMALVIEVVGGTAVAAALEMDRMAVEVVQVAADCSLEEDIQAGEACDLDWGVQLDLGSDSVPVGRACTGEEE